MDTPIPRTIVVTGGIVSGIGKGITAASLGRLLISRGFTVQPVKADPYLNQDAGTMNPHRHGEVFVTADGGETDLDLGHYERFLEMDLTRRANFTSGAVYRSVMDKEREGAFLGRDIQIIPHVTDEIHRRIVAAADPETDFLTCELGGTVGDIEALPFIETVRQHKLKYPTRTAFVHVVKMDYLYPSGEAKTKPIQHAVATLRSYGIQPDILVVRCIDELGDEERAKISLFTGVPESHVIAAPNAVSQYAIPAIMEANGAIEALAHTFGMEMPKPKPSAWDALATWHMGSEKRKTVRIGLVGKYVSNEDAYISVIESVRHAGFHHDVSVKIVMIDSEHDDMAASLKSVDGVIIPGGFGGRGIEGKIAAVKIAREQKIPLLGICLGLQVSVIEMARNLCGLDKANSTEFDESTPDPVITMMDEQRHITTMGGTMRLGVYPAKLAKGSLAEEVYATYRPTELHENVIIERHRHRYEVNPAYHAALEKAGLIFSGMSPDRALAEFIELPRDKHPYFIATQAHPEFRSRPTSPQPLFAGLVKAAKENAA